MKRDPLPRRDFRGMWHLRFAAHFRFIAGLVCLAVEHACMLSDARVEPACRRRTMLRHSSTELSDRLGCRPCLHTRTSGVNCWVAALKPL